ncbi:tetratricopeptide repeat protein [Cryptosporangium minutisporangium]|uniref:Tetratricopeptide repeat protein n=1 Tax=Cryptosporangium minutisporangium TaxID=113569 RepID=A0ABP6STE4_9ACTN
MWKSRRRWNAEADRHRGAAAYAYADGRFAEAEADARSALARRERAVGADSPAAAGDAVALAAVLAALDRRAEANALYQRALATYRRHSGPEHYDVAVCLHGLALLHADTEPALSRRRLQAALWIKRSALGGIHPEVVDLLDDLAALSAVPVPA